MTRRSRASDDTSASERSPQDQATRARRVRKEGIGPHPDSGPLPLRGARATAHRCPNWCHRCPDLDGEMYAVCYGSEGRDDLACCCCLRPQHMAPEQRAVYAAGISRAAELIARRAERHALSGHEVAAKALSDAAQMLVRNAGRIRS